MNTAINCCDNARICIVGQVRHKGIEPDRENMFVSWLLSGYPENYRQHHGNDDACRDREVETESFPLDKDIARKMTNAQPGQEGPYQADQNEYDADDDKPLCDDRYP